MNESTEIFVYLLDEDVDCWRPVEAVPIRKDLYEIISVNPNPEDENWQFTTGDVVRCVRKTLNDFKSKLCLVALEKVEADV